MSDGWDEALASPKQRREMAKKWQRISKPGHICGLCDKPATALIGIAKFDKSGIVLACSECVLELTT